jgi:hypothetical protein
MSQPLGELAIALDAGSAKSAEFVVSAPKTAIATAAGTTATTTRKPVKRGKPQPLPFGIPEQYAKFLTPKYLIGGGAGLIVTLGLLLWMVVGGGTPTPEKVRAIPVVPARAKGPAAGGNPAGPATAAPAPTAGMFNLPTTNVFPTGKRAK